MARKRKQSLKTNPNLAFRGRKRCLSDEQILWVCCLVDGITENGLKTTPMSLKAVHELLTNQGINIHYNTLRKTYLNAKGMGKTARERTHAKRLKSRIDNLKCSQSTQNDEIPPCPIVSNSNSNDENSNNDKPVNVTNDTQHKPVLCV